MANIKINPSSVLSDSARCDYSKSYIQNAKNTTLSVYYRLNNGVKQRAGIGTRLYRVSVNLENIKKHISSIQSTCNNAARTYRSTDAYLKRKANNISTSAVANFTGGKSKSSAKHTKRGLNISGAILSGGVSKAGKVFGIKSAGSASGELIGGSVKSGGKAKWDKNNISAEANIEAEGHLAKGKAKGNIGLLGGEVGGTVGSAAVTGALGASVFSDGKFSPSLNAKLKAEAAVAKGNAEAHIGSEKNNVHIKGKGTLLGAEAEASGSAGVITYKDEDTGMIKKEVGVKGKAGAEAYLAQGTLSGGCTIFGIKVDASVTGKAGGAGVGAEGHATAGGFGGGLSLGAGLGAGINVNVDWSDAFK